MTPCVVLKDHTSVPISISLCFSCHLSIESIGLQEDLERTQLNVLAVQAITSLVLSAMTLPTPGNPAVSCLEQQPRNKSLKALETR